VERKNIKRIQEKQISSSSSWRPRMKKSGVMGKRVNLGLRNQSGPSTDLKATKARI
jgi:hypothetical protein